MQEKSLSLPFPALRVGVFLLSLGTSFDFVQAAGSHGFLQAYSGPQTCAACHSTAFAEIMDTSHWTWEHTDPGTGERLGKNRVINNFCIAIASNEPRCTSCHIGLGYNDSSFYFGDPSKVDCLVCHDTTGTYKKTPTAAGLPDPAVDLLHVARSVGKSSRATCGACHFFGGGGDAVKHGDLDSTLKQPTRAVDVHMGTDGADMSCATCHVPLGTNGRGHHKFLGSHYTQAETEEVLSCENCHGAAPHENSLRNQHAQRVACQTCHIPAFARGGRATKMTWDWSTAGVKGPDGKPLVTKDANGNPTYDGMKGTFTWQANVVPDYVWFNGEVDYVTIAEQIDPAGVVRMTSPGGDIDDHRARIYPVKRFTGRQPYDAVRRTFVIPHLFPLSGGDTAAYWKGYNWTNAVVAGMSYAGLPFSGELGFVDTEMFWIQNHMVAPKEQALQCADCHVPRGRLDFAGLGYPAERAAALQTLRGFEIGTIKLSTPSSDVSLKWTGTPGNRYQVQVSSDLLFWADAPDGERTPGAVPEELNWVEKSASGGGARFYRILRVAE